MATYLSVPVVGIDVASEFSFAAILAPDGSIYKSPFKVIHSAAGFKKFLEVIKKAEKEFKMRPVFFLESTGVYHLNLFHFLKDNKCDAFVINPLVSNSNRNKGIRKVKNDKVDALAIAKMAKYEDIKVSSENTVNTLVFKMLVRDYHRLIDERACFRKKLTASLTLSFSGYNKIFSDNCADTSRAILKMYPSPSKVLAASKEELMDILLAARKGTKWAENKYQTLISCAHNAKAISLSERLSISVITDLNLYEAIDSQTAVLLDEIESFVSCNDLPPDFKENLELLKSIPGIGEITALTVLAEIGDIHNFSSPKQLTAFFGLDPAVNESGKFKSDRVKMSKRGTRIGRKALFAIAIVSIRKNKNGQALNQVLYDYYQGNLNNKKKKVALTAIMHKIIKYIFAVLRNKTVYLMRDPKIHQQMYLNNKIRLAS